MEGTRFTAVVGHLYLTTRDLRVMRAPENHGNLLRKGYPSAPVMFIDHDDKTNHCVGMITEAYVLGSEIIVHGRMDDQFPRSQELVKKLKDGELFFEMDVDNCDIGSRSGPVPVTTFTYWRLTALTIGSDSCWDSLPLRFWE